MFDFANAPHFNCEWGSNLLPPEIGARPSAKQLAAGIAQAALEGRIAAWAPNTPERDWEPAQQPDGSWLTCCPAHDDHNPSLVLSDAADELHKPKTLVYCRSGCDQDMVIGALDDLGLWSCTPDQIEVLEAAIRTSGGGSTNKPARKRSEPIVPVPRDAPRPPDRHLDLGPITARWPYRNTTGELIFYVCRFDPNTAWQDNYDRRSKDRVIERPDHKTFRPQSYCTRDDGTTSWQWVAPKSGVPLYNADRLAVNPAADVIVCEGEKAADAAQALFPDRVAVTWYSGAKAVAKAPWRLLQKRDILVWPDHDEAGAGAAQAVIRELRLAGCASISVLDAKALAAANPLDPEGASREPPLKWDAANALLEWKDRARLVLEINRNSNRLETRVLVELSPDNIGETADAAEDALRNSPLPVFKRGGCIVRAGQYQDKRANGTSQHVLIAQVLNGAGLAEVLERVIRFEQHDARSKTGMKPAHAPELLLKALLERGKLSRLQPLTALTDIPLVRGDGSLLDFPGYDDATGIYYQPSGSPLEIPKDLSLEDAKEAIRTLQHLIRDFPFQSHVDRAAAISAFVSAVNRATLGATPMHVFTAPTPGSGKSLLATLVTIVATGALPSFITQGGDDEELEKRLATQMLEGRQVINLDNCIRPLKGAALCNLLTAESVSLRILGQSKAPEIISSSFILVNGNNVRVADDVVRRAVVSHIDPQMERPEERAIDWDAKAEALRNRGEYVLACLVIMLAYQAAGAPKQTIPLGSFEGWSRRVRDALIWAGLPDPCANAGKLRDADPEKERFLEFATQWKVKFGHAWKKIADVISEANSAGTQNDELRAALMSIAASSAGRDASANRLAAFLSRYATRPLSGHKFMSRKGHAGTKLWRLEP